MRDEIKKIEDEAPKTEVTPALSEQKLDEVVGGKAQFHDMTFTKHVDKDSPILL